MSRMVKLLADLYGENVGVETARSLSAIIDQYRGRIPPPHALGLCERDAILITYGDQVQSRDAQPLQTLADFSERHLTGLVSGIHLLPFFPYSSDDGFAVVDYRTVNPSLGDWSDVERLGRPFRLMFDAVINHVSAESMWFRRFLQDDPRYRDFFIVVPDGADLSQVVRPRALPLLTQFETPNDVKNVWTTFSPDQVDLNYHNPAVLMEIVDTLLFYVAHGAEFLRLDAAAFLWKQIGTSCLHLSRTHHLIQLVRAVLDEVAPHVMLVTETNVPHAENISYLGDGRNEAQMVYNFALPPLVLHTFGTSSAETLSQWAGGLTLPSDRTTFFNFLASHDGIGINPVRGILMDAEIDALVAQALAHGGLVSYKDNPDGTTSPYELNISYFDALSDPQANEPVEIGVARFIAAQAIMLSIVGVPGIYFHSLFGSRSWRDGVAQTGQKRTINRQKCTLDALEHELVDPSSRRQRVYASYARLLRARAAQPAFHPYGEMRVLSAGKAIFGVLRISPDGSGRVLCLHNVSNRPQSAGQEVWGNLQRQTHSWQDLLTGQNLDLTGDISLTPYQVLWLIPNQT